MTPEEIIVRQLQAKVHEMAGLERIYSDYARIAQQNVTLQRRNRELERKNAESADAVEKLRRLSEGAEQLPEVQQKLTEAAHKNHTLQEELTDALRRRAALTDELMAQRESLDSLTKAHQAQTEELTQAKLRIALLTERVGELSQVVDHERAARALACEEAEARLKDREDALVKAEKLEAENRQLVTRMMEMKLEQADKLNEIGELYIEVENLRRQADALKEAAANAASSGASAVAVLAAIAKGETEFSLVGVPSDPYRREKAHDNGVYACTFARSGDKLATVGGDKYVRVWDAATGGQLAQFQGGAQSSMLDVAWTSDDRFLLAACSDKAVRVYDVSTQRERHTMTGHDKKVTSVRAFPSDKLRAASCAEDRSIKIWDLSTGFCKQTLLGCHSTPIAIEIPSDGLVLVSGHFDGRLRIWDIRSGKQLMESAPIHSAPIVNLAQGRSGGSLYSLGRDSAVHVIDTRTYESTGALGADGFSVQSSYGQIAVSGEGWYCAAGSSDGRVFVWDLRKMAVSEVLRAEKGQGHGREPVYGLAWNAQGAPMVSGDRSGLLVFWK